MAMTCVTAGRECDGCGACRPEPETVGTCEGCHDPIYCGEAHYDIDGRLIHEDCLREWAERYRVTV